MVPKTCSTTSALRGGRLVGLRGSHRWKSRQHDGATYKAQMRQHEAVTRTETTRHGDSLKKLRERIRAFLKQV
jgi:hypothetical protein